MGSVDLSPHTTEFASVLSYLGGVDVSHLLSYIVFGVLCVVHAVKLKKTGVMVRVTATSSISKDGSLDVETRRLHREKRATKRFGREDRWTRGLC